MDEENIIQPRRNAVVMVLLEGDILVDVESVFYKVIEGEVTIYSNGLVDASYGELEEVNRDEVNVLNPAIQIFYMGDL